MTQKPTHPCAICDVQVKSGKLMCLPHWKLVPSDQQRQVYSAWTRYRYSDGGEGSRQRALRLYNSARDAAIASAQAALEAFSTPTGAP